MGTLAQHGAVLPLSFLHALAKPVQNTCAYAMYYAVWWKKNIYLGMIVHCLMNIIGTIF